MHEMWSCGLFLSMFVAFVCRRVLRAVCAGSFAAAFAKCLWLFVVIIIAMNELLDWRLIHSEWNCGICLIRK